MTSLFSFRGRLSRRAFVAAALSVFLCQHLAVFAALAAMGEPFSPQWWFWFTPLRALVQSCASPPWVPLSAMAALLVVNAALAALAMRRARDAGLGEGAAALVIAPGLQIVVLIVLCLRPTAAEPAPDVSPPPRLRNGVLIGLVVGALLSVAAVAANTLWLGVYGWSLFLASPFLIGLVTAYLSNADTDIGMRRTLAIVAGALFIGAVGIMLVAFEGLICLVMASPLIFGSAWLGAAMGRELARRGGRARRSTMASVAFLPIFFMGEALLPPQAAFDDTQSVVIAAPPARVWDAIVHMGPIPDAPAPPFGWGLAYPVDGKILGQGVGAIRVGYFSTGVAYERITSWNPNRVLAFDVLSDPPSMRELSPYAHVNAPHVIGYFRTTTARFDITPLENGKTRLSLTTHHDLDLEPALYWTPIARWAVDANKDRVLNHFRRQAEGQPRVAEGTQ